MAPVVRLKTLWQQTTTDEKLDFLRQLPDEQPDLQAQFEQYTQVKLVRPLKLGMTHVFVGKIHPNRFRQATGRLTPQFKAYWRRALRTSAPY